MQKLEERPDELDPAEKLRAQIRRLCREIPAGRVISYGALGARCEPPVSGYICGRIIGQLMDDVAWWRVVGKSGTLPISKRGLDKAIEQRKLLQNEGVTFEDDVIGREFFEDESPTRGENAQGELF